MKKYFLILCIPFILFAEPGFHRVQPLIIPGLTSYSNPFVGPSSAQMHVGYAFGNYIGLKEGYLELGGFITPGMIERFQPLIDLKVYRLNNSHWAASIGGGARWKDSCDRIWGANLFYDYRKAHFGNFNRIGLGAELFNSNFWGFCFDYRLNIYLPIKSEHSKKRAGEEGEGYSVHKDSQNNWEFGQSGNSIREKEFTFTGVDFEVGRRVWERDTLWLYAAAGPYYYHHDRSIGGFQARLGLNWTQYLLIEARASFDNVFKSNLQGMITFNLPLPFWLPGCNPDEEMVQPIYRNGVIFEKHKEEK